MQACLTALAIVVAKHIQGVGGSHLERGKGGQALSDGRDGVGELFVKGGPAVCVEGRPRPAQMRPDIVRPLRRRSRGHLNARILGELRNHVLAVAAVLQRNDEAGKPVGGEKSVAFIIDQKPADVPNHPIFVQRAVPEAPQRIDAAHAALRGGAAVAVDDENVGQMLVQVRAAAFFAVFRPHAPGGLAALIKQHVPAMQLVNEPLELAARPGLGAVYGALGNPLRLQRRIVDDTVVGMDLVHIGFVVENAGGDEAELFKETGHPEIGQGVVKTTQVNTQACLIMLFAQRHMRFSFPTAIDTFSAENQSSRSDNPSPFPRPFPRAQPAGASAAGACSILPSPRPERSGAGDS